MDTKGPSDEASFAVGRVFWDIALNAIIPLVLYRLAKRYISPSEMTALLVATTFPISKSIFDLVIHRQLDPISILVLLGILASAVALLLGGRSAYFAVARISFYRGIRIGLLGSLFLPRPMMFYFGRHFQAGADPVRRQRYDASWSLPHVRFANRLITIVWGVVYLGRIRNSRSFYLSARYYMGSGAFAHFAGRVHCDHPDLDLSVCAESTRTGHTGVESTFGSPDLQLAGPPVEGAHGRRYQAKRIPN